MTHDQVIEKIKKLLRMKRGGTRGEIENALVMAAELARKHGIDLAGVDPDAETQKINHISELLTSRLPLEAKFAAGILVNFFNVNVIVSQQRHPRRPWDRVYILNLVGNALDTEVARYVFAFLQKHFRRCWAQRENRRLKNREAFINGMFLGLAYKLENERRQSVNEAGLVLIGNAVAERKNYVAKHWPDSKESNLKHDDSGANAAREAGVTAGLATNIRKAVATAPAPARPQLAPAAGQLALF